MQTMNFSYACMHTLNVNPPVLEIKNFLSIASCERLVRFALNGRGMQIDGTRPQMAGSTSTIRTSTSWLMNEPDVVELLSKIQDLTGIIYSPTSPFLHPPPICLNPFPASHTLVNLTGCPSNRLEFVQVIRYRPGQQYSWHLDYLPTPEACGAQGNRLATLLVYLNTPSSGGQTCFRDLNIQVEPTQGKALLFFPTFLEGGLPDFRTVHCSALSEDTKYVAQVFIRHGTFADNRGPFGT